MGRTASNAPGYVPDSDDLFDPLIDDFVAKQRNYTHFDYALSKDNRKTFEITDEQIVTHSFWPLLGFAKKERRAKKDKQGSLVISHKTREIKFGSHTDAAVLQWHTACLSQHYEKAICLHGINDCVLAYRSGMGDNITQARDLFNEIKSIGHCTAIALDISRFFDNIDHEMLLQNLKMIVNVERLPNAYFKIFERMTKFEYVDADVLKARLKRIRTPTGRLCTPLQFRNIVKPVGNSLIKTNTECFGIPQGTPLSGLYANISMFAFDRKMSRYVGKKGGIYRRYSDDIALVIPASINLPTVLRYIKSEIRKSKLQINSKKTEISKFHLTGHSVQCDQPFQYLGFTFDGSKTLIRSSSLARYYTKMRRGIRAKILAAFKKGIPRDEIFMRELFRRYTHFGRVRNFPRYAYRAAKVFQANEIKKQIRPHMNQFKKFVKEETDTLYEPVASNSLEV
jgi:RNA-directed DNA polymerase